jgi:uncharacterized protein YbjT (DUF2867 family)
MTSRRGEGALWTGPVAITGASGHVGTALQRCLNGYGNEVRSLGRRDDLAAAFHDAAAVVHLAGTLRPEPPSTYADANLRTVERTIEALEGSSVERVVFLSYVGASARAGNAYLRTKGEAEDLLYRCGRDVVIFRCSHIYGPPSDPGSLVSAVLAGEQRRVWVLGSGRQRIAPVYREDVVEAVIRAALDPGTYHGRFDLPGPDVVRMDDFVRIMNGGRVTLRHVPSRLARTLAHATASLTPELVDVMVSDSLGDEVRVDRAFALERHHLGDIYAGAAAAAA